MRNNKLKDHDCEKVDMAVFWIAFKTKDGKELKKKFNKA